MLKDDAHSPKEINGYKFQPRPSIIVRLAGQKSAGERERDLPYHQVPISENAIQLCDRIECIIFGSCRHCGLHKLVTIPMRRVKK